MPIKDLKKAALRIKKAIQSHEKIILFSDGDLDGVASLLILEETIQSLGGKIALSCFPNRETDGYGLNFNSLVKIKKLAPALLVITDTGITSFKEIDEANKMGFTIIVVDHHEIIDNQLPKALAVIDPKREDDTSSFKFLAACGLSFYLARDILGRKISAQMEKNLVELAALGTIADMMPQEKDNVEIIALGSSSLPKTDRPALAYLWEYFAKMDFLSDSGLPQKVASFLHLTDFQGDFPESYLILKELSKQKIIDLSQKILAKGEEKRKLMKEVCLEVERGLVGQDNRFIFYSKKDLPYLISGSVASRVSSHLKKPVFIVALREKISRGSARSTQGYNLVEALKTCSGLLESFGGHPQAAGFAVQNQDIEKFKECLESYFNNSVSRLTS